MSVEEDSEPLLGLWFEETLAPLDGSPTNTTKDTANEAVADRNATTIVPDNKEPHGVSLLYLFLLFLLFNFHFFEF